jgi:hypothetical protein
MTVCFLDDIILHCNMAASNECYNSKQQRCHLFWGPSCSGGGSAMSFSLGLFRRCCLRRCRNQRSHAHAAQGQWIELHNTDKSAAVLLRSWNLDCRTGFNRFTFGATTISANGFLTIGRNNIGGYIDIVWSGFPS